MTDKLLETPSGNVVKIPIKGDTDLEALIKSANGLGYSRCLNDVVTIIGEMSKDHPKAAIFMLERLKAKNKFL